jgi:hypothetical protein
MSAVRSRTPTVNLYDLNDLYVFSRHSPPTSRCFRPPNFCTPIIFRSVVQALIRSLSEVADFSPGHIWRTHLPPTECNKARQDVGFLLIAGRQSNQYP